VKRTFALLLVAVLAGGCAPKRAPEFPPRTATLRRVAIIPLEVHLARIVFSGDDEPLSAEADIARRELPSAITPELEAHGFTVRPARLDESDPSVTDNLRYLATTAAARHAAFVSANLAGKPTGGLGTDIGALADHADVDALLFVQMVGMTKSGGQVARDVAVTVLTFGHVIYPTSATQLFATLIDGTSGAVIWWGWRRKQTAAFGGYELRELVHELFKPWPSLPPPSNSPDVGPAPGVM
jgi:hypothetical protein